MNRTPTTVPAPAPGKRTVFFRMRSHCLGRRILQRAHVTGFIALLVHSFALPHGRAAVAPAQVYVDDDYIYTTALLTFPAGQDTNTTPATLRYGIDAFRRVQEAIDAVATGGTVHIAPGSYTGNLTIRKTLNLTGPHAGSPAVDTSRPNQAIIRPHLNEPENTPLVSVEANDVTLDGLTLDGQNLALGAGYHAGTALVHAAAAVQNGLYTAPVAISRLTVRNNILRQFSYSAIWLEVLSRPATSGHRITGNNIQTAWDAIYTYGAHAEITGNRITNCNTGISVHGVSDPSLSSNPLVAGNHITLAGWWPQTELPERTRRHGLWINYRREQAAPLLVASNTVAVPQASPATLITRGIIVQTIDGNATVQLQANELLGHTNLDIGLLLLNVLEPGAVTWHGGSIRYPSVAAVSAETWDPKYGSGSVSAQISNLVAELGPSAHGVVVVAPATNFYTASLTLLGSTRISGGNAAIHVVGSNAAITARGPTTQLTGNRYGACVEGGRALLERVDLSGNSITAIHAQDGAIVDAGDCAGENLTNLRTGSGVNGSSIGGNTIASSLFNGQTPFAIVATGSVTRVRAHASSFALSPGQDPRRGIVGDGEIHFSQLAPVFVSAPSAAELLCTDPRLAAPKTFQDFLDQGGLASFYPGALSVTDTPAPEGVVRQLQITSPCGESVTCGQNIRILHSGSEPSASLALSLNGDTGVLKLQGCPTTQFVLQCSTNLVNWSDLATGRPPFSYTETKQRPPLRFYRMRARF